MNKTIKLFVFLFGFLVVCQGTNAQWRYMDHPEYITGAAIDAVDVSTIVFSGSKEYPQFDFLLLSSNEDSNWINISPFNKWGESPEDISIIDKNNIWIATADMDSARIMYTKDGGSSWETQFMDSSKTKFFNYIEMFDLNNGIAMADGKDNIPLFLKTTDGGKFWESMNDSSFGGISGDTWRRLDFVTADIGYFYASGINPNKLYKTINGAETWKEANYLGGLTVLHFYNESIGLLYDIADKKIHRTINGGETWEGFEINASGWGNDIEFIPGDPSQVWFTDHSSLFYSSDTGRTWVKHAILRDSMNFRDIVFTDEKHGWILGDNGTLLYTDNNDGLVTNVKEVNTEPIPNEIKLYQNYPNPFNPVTTIKYSIKSKVKSEKSNVKLIVYDVIGNEIATLVNEQKSTGNYEVKFDASNLSSGIYYYQLTAGDFIKTNKMILLK